jgi:Zn-dependent protease with chaperone function
MKPRAPSPLPGTAAAALGLRHVGDEAQPGDLSTDVVVLLIVPAKPAHGVARLWATHPPLEDRIRRLERLEAWLQA